ncbi:MAG: restriction endonuclease [Burkholderiales bacterium]|nr:restriction endonuclease [Burkholderiales bacterium]
MGRKSNAQKKAESHGLLIAIVLFGLYYIIKWVKLVFNTTTEPAVILCVILVLICIAIYVIRFHLRQNASINLAKTIILSHKDELTIKRSQLSTKRYNRVEDDRWTKEEKYFIENIVMPELRMVNATILNEIHSFILENTANYANIKIDFNSKMTPYEYEHFVANVLSQSGWDCIVTKSSGDQGIDVIATKKQKKVVAQCKLYSRSVGNTAVQEITAGRMHKNADYAIVVSNSTYTKSAIQLASTTNVLLLHHSNLNDLDRLLNLT